jgi:hypothetical protein
MAMFRKPLRRSYRNVSRKGIGGRGRLTSDFPSMVTADSKRESAGLLMSSGQNLRINIVKDLNNFRNSGEKSVNRGRNRHRDRDDD